MGKVFLGRLADVTISLIYTLHSTETKQEQNDAVHLLPEVFVCVTELQFDKESVCVRVRVLIIIKVSGPFNYP